MNSWLICILLILTINFALTTFVSILNLGALSPNLPEEFKDVYDQEKYRLSQEYTRETTRFSLIEAAVSLAATLFFILAGGFQYIDSIARSFGFSHILTGLIFTALLGLLSYLLSLPFSLYTTFVLEEKYGFNTTTFATYLSDTIKSIFLALIIGAPVLALILWFFESAGSMAWLYCWIGVTVISFILQLIAPVLIMPLFNKFTPLEDGVLKEMINRYAKEQHFSIQGIFTMDGSKRSTKLNAFFTGFGKFRKIVFFDTLVETLNNDQILAVLAHEMGHYKLRHIYKMLFFSIIQTGLLFFLLSLILNNRGLFDAFQMEYVSIYASLVFFGFLYTPISFFISLVFHLFSRKHEYEADAYAAKTSGKPQNLIESLKILSSKNLSNLTPHPLYVFMHYSHPPLLERIRTLHKLYKQQ